MRTSDRLRSVALLVGLAFGAPALAAPEPHVPDAGAEARRFDWDALVAEGGAAPADAWPLPDGSASGSRLSAARPLTGELETAWTFEAKGALVSEPVVARDRVVLEETAPDGQRVVHVLSLASGRELYRKVMGKGPALRPFLVADRVVLRARDDSLECHQIGQRMLTKRWDHRLERGGEQDVVAHRGQVLLAGESSLEILDALDGKTLASIELPKERRRIGGLAAFGDGAYVLVEDDAHNLEAQGFGLRAAVAHRPVFVGARSESCPPAPWGGPAIVLGPDDAFVLHGKGVRTESGRDVDVTLLRHRPGSGVTFRSVLDLGGRPTFSERGWVGLVRDPEGGRLLVRGTPSAATLTFEVFAQKDSHPEWAREGLPLTTTRDVTLVGLSAFRPATRDVLRERRAAIPARPVPVKDLLLLLEPPRTLRALREVRGPAAPVAVPLATDPGATAPIPLGPCAFVLDDGEVVEASVAFDPVARALVSAEPKSKQSWPVDGIRTVVARASPARLRLARTLEGLVADLAAISDVAGAKAWTALAIDAAAAGDAARARTALDVARSSGASDADLARAEAALTAPKTRARPKDPKAAAGLDAREAALRAGLPRLLGELADGIPADASIHVATAIWRAALARDPVEPQASAWIRARLPKALPLLEPFDPEDALAILESDAEAALRIVVPPAKGAREAELSMSQKHLGAAMHHWRKDLTGIESGELLLLTPLSKPGRISHCLSLGRLVSKTLEEMFSSGTNVRKDPWPLLHHLYESKEEYLAQSTKRMPDFLGEAGRRGLARTAGHFDREEGLTRVYLPDGVAGFEAIRETYAHELTHHWMEARCPLYRELDVRHGGGTPGMWVVEGLADFVAEMRYDLARRRVDPFSPTASFLDVVAHVERPIDWAWLYGAPQLAAYALSAAPTLEVPLRRRLGVHLRVSELNLFYAQSAATCAYLWNAESGTHRKAFVELVAARYTGTLGRGETKARFGLDEAALGAKVVAWCRQVLDGKGP